MEGGGRGHPGSSVVVLTPTDHCSLAARCALCPSSLPTVLSALLVWSGGFFATVPPGKPLSALTVLTLQMAKQGRRKHQ